MLKNNKIPIDCYESLLGEMWTASAKYLGAFSVNLLVERVVWEVAQEYREIELLQFDQDGISLSELAAYLKKNPDFPVDDMFKKFFSMFFEILVRLIGYEKTEKIKNEMNEEIIKNLDIKVV